MCIAGVSRCDCFTIWLLFAVCILFQEAQILEFERFVRSFPRALDAVTYDIRNISCSANMRNLARTADIVICSFPGFSQARNAVIDSTRRISKTAYAVICICPSFSEARNAAFCRFRNLPRAATKDQRTKRPEDQGTRGPGTQSHT